MFPWFNIHSVIMDSNVFFKTFTKLFRGYHPWNGDYYIIGAIGFSFLRYVLATFTIVGCVVSRIYMFGKTCQLSKTRLKSVLTLASLTWIKKKNHNIHSNLFLLCPFFYPYFLIFEWIGSVIGQKYELDKWLLSFHAHFRTCFKGRKNDSLQLHFIANCNSR